MPRSFSIAIQSDWVVRRFRLALTWPASWMAPPNSRSFSVSVVLPASGWEMMAKVRRRSISSASGERLWPAPGARIGAFMGAYLQSQGLNSRLVQSVSRAQRSASEASGAVQTRDRNGHRLWNGPGSAAHRYALHRVRDT